MMNAGIAHRKTRVAAALLAGILLAVPAGWLLATLSLLPAFLGLFFDMLLGLLLGAVVYRIARPAGPLPWSGAAAMGIVVASTTWAVGLAGEYYNTRGYNLPWHTSAGWRWIPIDGDATRSVRRFFSYKSLSPQQVESLRAETQQAFQQQLEQHYPPGGFVGFLSWSAAKKGSLELPRVYSASTNALNPKQRGPIWLIRLALSLILLMGAVGSQVLGLAQTQTPRTIDPASDPGPLPEPRPDNTP